MCIHRSNARQSYELVPSHIKDELSMPQSFEELKHQQQQFLLDFQDAVVSFVTSSEQQKELLEELSETERDLQVALHSVRNVIHTAQSIQNKT
jgi:hypothetical protein